MLYSLAVPFVEKVHSWDFILQHSMGEASGAVDKEVRVEQRTATVCQ